MTRADPVIVSVNGELNDFLPKHQRGKEIHVNISAKRSVKDLIESLGVPHAEIDRIEVNNNPAAANYSVAPGDRIRAYPLQMESDEFSLIPRLGLKHPKFIVDDNVARLAKILRLLGFDTYQEPGLPDPGIVERAAQDGRVILTRDRGLLKRRNVSLGFYLRETSPYKQAQEIIEKLRLSPLFDPFSRCLVCNGNLGHLPAGEANNRTDIPGAILHGGNELYTCDACRRVYWEGSHYLDMVNRIDELTSDHSIR